VCGLVGAFRSDKGIFTKASQYITQGLFISVLRGYSGTGVGIVNSKFKPDFVKSRLASPDFIQTKNYTWVENSAPMARAIMGHTRAPTGGTASHENSHPFWYVKTDNAEDSILLTHNGHVSNYHSLTPQGFRHDVDSAHVTHSILVDGAIDTLQKLEGYYVLTWYSEKDKQFHMARNDNNRDLFLAYSPLKDIIYYASEEGILRFLLDRLDIPYLNKGTPEAFWRLEPLKMYSWDLTKDYLENPVVQEYEEKKRTYTTTTYYGGGRTGGGMPEVGDKIYVDCEENQVVLYTNSTTHGYVNAKRRLDNGKVRIEGVTIEEWEHLWKHVKGSLPCVVDHSHKEILNGLTTYHYKVRVHKQEATLDANHRRALPPPNQEGAKKKETEESKQVGLVALPSTLGSDKKSSEDVSQPMLRGPNDTLIPLPKWREIAKLGCVGCNGTILSLDKDLVGWYPWARSPEDPPEDTEWQMICPLCVKDPSKMVAIFGA
jgi:predicted glutamine amidotransferase